MSKTNRQARRLAKVAVKRAFREGKSIGLTESGEFQALSLMIARIDTALRHDPALNDDLFRLAAKGCDYTYLAICLDDHVTARESLRDGCGRNGCKESIVYARPMPRHGLSEARLAEVIGEANAHVAEVLAERKAEAPQDVEARAKWVEAQRARVQGAATSGRLPRRMR